MEQISYTISDQNLFEKQLLVYFKDVKNIVFLNSNNTEKTNLFAFSTSNKTRDDSWKFGFITYDYKNQIEDLYSAHYDGVKFPEIQFFTPEILFKIRKNKVEILYNKGLFSALEIEIIIGEIEKISVLDKKLQSIEVAPRITKYEYLENVRKLKQHIQFGDIYEINYCQEYFAKGVKINPIDFYLALNKKSPTPFSCFVKSDDQYLMSATPERFIHKSGEHIVSQPIKGTAKRGGTKVEDEQLRKELFNDVKERSENVMIVDLVRNDLSKISKRGSVNVDELCGIYTFPQVHQMISTVSGKIKNSVNFDDIINATFPMGSMTGAPKVKAMELIEQYEKTKRGLYAGTVGYIAPNGDFDLNVVIRSLQYNKNDEYLSFIVGGAITSLSDPEKEYDECLLKAKAMLEVLRN
jgi:para-aminobenzoate synthetase component 1